MTSYVHGYDERANERLRDQAAALVDLLHHDTAYPAGARVLEAGCGVGAQTVTLAANSPEAHFVSVDLSADSVAEARRRTRHLDNVELMQGDLFALPFEPASFDHAFVCFVLEHLPQPVAALKTLIELVKPGGSVTVIEGDHGSAYFHPDSADAHAAIQCQVELQHRGGGDSEIGRQVFPLMVAAGLGGVAVSPRMVYVDESRPELRDMFTHRTFTAMIEGVRESALIAGLIEPERFDAGIRDLYATDVFCYTFFKGVGYRPAA